MTGVRIVGLLRDWINGRDRRRLARHTQPPEDIERHYWDRAEYGKDAAGTQHPWVQGSLKKGERPLCPKPHASRGVQRSDRPPGPVRSATGSLHSRSVHAARSRLGRRHNSDR